MAPPADRLGAELVDQHERLAVGLGEHLLHVRQEGAVRREVVVYGLVVAYADHNSLEYREFRSLRCRDEHSPLEHVLQQAGGLEADGLAARIGTGDHQDVLRRRELHGQRDYLLGLLLEGALQQGMPRLAQLERAVLGDHRHARDEVERRLRLRHYEIYLSEESRRLDELRHVRTEEVAEIVEDAGDLPRLVKAEGADLVLHLDDLHRLDEDGLAGGGLFVHEALDPAFRRGRDGDQELPVTDVHGGVRLHDAVLLGLAEYRPGLAGDGGLLVFQLLAYFVKFRGGGVFHLPVAVDDGVYPLLDVLETAYRGGHPLEVRIDPVLHPGKECRHLGEGAQHRS